MGPLAEAESGLFRAAAHARATQLAFYSPYNFLRAFPAEQQLAAFVAPRLEEHLRGTGAHRVFRTEQQGQAIYFLFTELAWDTAFFGRPVVRLYTVLFERPDVAGLALATEAFRHHVLDKLPGAHCFCELPSEDIVLVQALGRVGFGLVETRCSFYHDTVATFSEPRYPVRQAHGEADATLIGSIAAAARNEFDRFHADAYLLPDEGDRLLRAYAEAAVRGYCDAVLVPGEAAGVPVDSFLAISHLAADATTLGVGLARVVLTAVGPANRGWHQRLVAETVHYARERAASYVLMTTQSTNRAVFRTTEKLGWKLGGTTHVLSAGARTAIPQRD